MPNRKDAFLIVWDPTIVSSEKYAELIVSIGDLVRAEGGVGIEVIDPDVDINDLTYKALEVEEQGRYPIIGRAYNIRYHHKETMVNPLVGTAIVLNEGTGKDGERSWQVSLISGEDWDDLRAPDETLWLSLDVFEIGCYCKDCTNPVSVGEDGTPHHLLDESDPTSIDLAADKEHTPRPIYVS